MLHYLEFVGIERARLHGERTYGFSHAAHYFHHPKRTLHGQHQAFAEFARHYLAKFVLCVAAGLAYEVSLAGSTMLQRVEHGSGEVLDVNKGEHLLFKAYREVESHLYALHHQIIVAFVRAIHACAAEYGVREVGNRAQIALGIEFRHAVEGIWEWNALRTEWCVILVVALPHHAQAAHHQEHFGHGIKVAQGLHQELHIVAVDGLKHIEIDALGGAKVVHHIVPLAILLDVFLERGVQIVGLGEIEFYEINARVGEKLERSGGTHSCPSLIAAAERLCHYKTSYKASRSGYQYLFCHFLFCNSCY